MQSIPPLVTDREEDIDAATLHLSRIGIGNVQGALGGDFGAWRKSGEPIRRSGTITCDQLAKEREHYQVLDVREIDEYDGGHIPDSHHRFVGDLPGHIEALGLDRNRPVVVTCSVGHRAGLGVSILLRAGFGDVRNLLGGMTAWRELGLEIE